MVRNSKQGWKPGNTVKIGFMELRIVECIPTPGNSRPDGYVLCGRAATYYSFVPHFGLKRHQSINEARTEVLAS